MASNDLDLSESPVDETNSVLNRSPLIMRETPGERFLVTAVMAQCLSPGVMVVQRTAGENSAA